MVSKHLEVNEFYFCGIAFHLPGNAPHRYVSLLDWKPGPQDLVMCLILSLGIVGPLMNFTTYVNETKTVEYAVHDVDKLLHVQELPDTGKPVEVQSKDIQLQDVSFSYDKESGKQVLSHINLKIPEGKFTALVGPSVAASPPSPA